MIVVPRPGEYRVDMSATSAREIEAPKSLLAGSQFVDPFARQHAFLHGIATRMASAVPFEQLLTQVVDFVTSVVACDSCFVYVLEGDALILAGFQESSSRSREPAAA